MVTFSIQEPSGDLQAAMRAGPMVASGRPRLVIVMVPPRLPISSSSAKQVALNSVTFTTPVLHGCTIADSTGQLTIWGADSQSVMSYFSAMQAIGSTDAASTPVSTRGAKVITM